MLVGETSTGPLGAGVTVEVRRYCVFHVQVRVVFIVIVNVTAFSVPVGGRVSGEPLALQPVQTYLIPEVPATGVATLAVISGGEGSRLYVWSPTAGSGEPYRDLTVRVAVS